MKRLLFILQFALFITMNFFLLLAVYEFFQPAGVMGRPGVIEPRYNLVEEFDPSLKRLNNIKRLSAYVDSVYANETYTKSNIRFETDYPEVANEIVRKRFYHGYSLYGFGNNSMAMLASKASVGGLSAIVLPNDILKFPYAACSQQSIVLMKLLQQKGFETRKVAFLGKLGGHFCFEVYYNGAWHFMDPNMEPDLAVLNAYNRPGIDFLASHPEILFKAYKQYPREKVLDLFSNYSYGKVNAPAAPNAYIFQKVTRFLSYTIWTFFLVLFILVRQKALRMGTKKSLHLHVTFPQIPFGKSQAMKIG